jgi:hypothetical protein
MSSGEGLLIHDQELYLSFLHLAIDRFGILHTGFAF